MATTPLDVAASKYNIASLKETQGDLEGARRLFLESVRRPGKREGRGGGGGEEGKREGGREREGERERERN